jgi:class 3 adenylate cyclase
VSDVAAPNLALGEAAVRRYAADPHRRNPDAGDQPAATPAADTLCSVAPRTEYARAGDARVAYQVYGEGPRDVVFVSGAWSHVELVWEVPAGRRFLERLAGFARVIHFDKRGSGLSDPVARPPTLEQRMDDVRAVMDAARFERAALVGVSEGGPMSILFAASHPARAERLALYGSFARVVGGPDYEWGIDREFATGLIDAIVAGWGEGVVLPLIAPSKVDDRAFVEEWCRFERYSLSPAMFEMLMTVNVEIDVRPVLPAVQVPALILHRVGDGFVPVQVGRELAEQMPDARYVELAGDDHLFLVDPDQIADEIEEFLTGTRPSPASNRVLSTVLFTDIVGSTETASRMGDRGWRDVGERHDALVRRELSRFRGHEIKTMGDGFLATFDGPARAIECACAVRQAVSRLGIEIRAGLHTGECELAGDDVRGMAVNIAARVAAAAAPGEVLASSTVRDLVAGADISFVERGSHELKGVPGTWSLVAVAR